MTSLTSADRPSTASAEAQAPLDFESLYDTHFPFVWRSVLRLGIPKPHADDVVQEIFVVVHRKLGAFEGRSSLRTWLYGITLRVARVHRARLRRGPRVAEVEPEGVPGAESARPDERAQAAEAARLVNGLLDGMNDEQREVFVLAELEELSAPEIAQVLGVKLNTVYSRLRLGRAAFAEAAARHRARDGWRLR